MKNIILLFLLSISFHAFADRMPSSQTFMIIKSDLVVLGTISKIESLYIYFDVVKSTASTQKETIKIKNPNKTIHHRSSSAYLEVGQTWIFPLKRNEQYSFVDLLDYGLSSNAGGFYCHTNSPYAYIQTKDEDQIFDAIKQLKKYFTTEKDKIVPRFVKNKIKESSKNKIADMWLKECKYIIHTQNQ